jgi:hypothetical protein
MDVVLVRSELFKVSANFVGAGFIGPRQQHSVASEGKAVAMIEK